MPCKFFKVGSCTAGVSCPFSHANNEPGQPKGVCAWFVKGNCKFGHKCALAHILPGQSMSMDRKNKKAAQLAANANGQSKEGGKGGKSSKSGSQSGPGSVASAGGSGSTRNTLLSGSTAPTRILQGSARGPMPIPLKAAVSPSAPAPPVQDTDFASYGLPDESNKLPSAPAQNKSFASPSKEDSPLPASEDVLPDVNSEQGTPAAPSDSPLPFHSPSAPRQMRLPANPTDLGPIGSPRSVSSHGQIARANGFSPGTSPSQGAGVLSTSPFSAPGAQSVFFSYENKSNPSDDLKVRSGIAASLGATHAWRADLPPGGAQDDFGGEIVVEDEDLEEFVPGSLSELLTPEEKSRKYSRTHHTNVTAGAATAWGANPRPSAETHHHRYSRSVPAPSLLGDIKSIWSEGGQGVIGSPRKSGMDLGPPGGALPAVGNGTPSSLRSSSAFGGHSLADDHINSFLSPSNASAAFLPGNYQNYLSSRNGAPRAGMAAGVSGLRGQTPSNVNGSPNMNAANLLARINDPAPVPPTQRQPFDGTSESLGNQPFQLGRPIPTGGDLLRGNGEDGRNVLSPSARALQAHAPGQSLPQGLAAGYSRIHALPPPPGVASPATSSAFTPSQPNSFAPSTSFQANASERVQFSEWIGMSPGTHPASNAHSHAVAGLESLASRAQYANVTMGRPPVGPGSVTASRNASGKSWGTPLSPLSRPVVTGDDDDLFDMDR